MDQDYDGYLTAQDFARFFGQDGGKIDFSDLAALIKNKDSKHVGKLNYTYFSK